MLCAITANAARCQGGQSLPLQPRRGSSIASLLPKLRVLARGKLVPRLAASRAAQLLAWAAITRRLDSSLAAALEDDVDKRC